MFRENKNKVQKIALIIFILVCSYWLLFIKKPVMTEPKWGVTFSPSQASDLGLDWTEVYWQILTDLKVKYFRLVAPWNMVEPKPGLYDFAALDWQLDEAAKVGAKVNLAIGEKTPRWPECHFNEWMWKLGETEREQKVLALLTVIVNRYKNHPAIYRWQVENERLFPFGVCPSGKFSFLRKEMALVKKLDPNHQVMTTDSGELSSWLRTAAISDVLPVSMYRVVWNKYFGHFFWPLTPALYFYHASAVSWLVPEVIISELQTEPWSNKALLNTSLEDQSKSMNPEIFNKNIVFARETGFPEVYLWGAEWWYWMKTKNNQPYYWNTSKELFK